MAMRGCWRWMALGVLSAAGGMAWASGPHHGSWQEGDSGPGKPEWQIREEQRQRTQQQWERDQEWQRRQQEEQRQRAEMQRRRDEAWQRQQEAELRRRADDQRRRDEAWQRQQEREQERRAAWQHRGSYGTVYPPDYPPGYDHRWERGQRYDGPVYIVQDYGRYRLRRPPHGHHWVRADRGYLLITTSSGVIVEVVAR